MKGINISCSSHASTAIYTPISMDQPSSSSSSSSSSLFPVTLLGGSAGGGGGSRAIDRHNPIIADERRVSRSTPPTSSHSTPFFTPRSSPSNHQKKTPKKPTSKAKKNSSITSSTSINANLQIHALEKGASKAAAVGPPESSRYLLYDPPEEFGSGFLDSEISSSARHHELAAAPKLQTKPPLPLPLPPTSNSSSDHQVVVLRVSLHCRGCEGKVRKHISRMQGVTSFNIDFAAKKVTVAGDVTPLQVLASISKVKNAQIWTPPASSSAPKPRKGA